VGSGWQSNHGISTNNIGTAMEKVTEASLFNAPQSLNAGEHPINNAIDWFGTSKRKYHSTQN